jgi:cell division protein FtsB
MRSESTVPAGRIGPARGERDLVLRPARLLALGGLVVICLLYWKPVHSYEHTRTQLGNRDGEVSRLRAEQRQLKERLSTVGTGPELVREARRLGFVKPGEQLFIVRGIAGWRAGQ